MALFSRNEGGREDEYLAADVATRALSVTAVETDFVAGVYEKLASVYDIIFGPTLHPGRLQALQRMAIGSGDRVLEVGEVFVRVAVRLRIDRRVLQPVGRRKVHHFHPSLEQLGRMAHRRIVRQAQERQLARLGDRVDIDRLALRVHPFTKPAA